MVAKRFISSIPSNMSELLNVSAIKRLQDKTVERVVVAVSGGVDSTALLHSVAAATVVSRLEALHVNHGLVANADQLERAAQKSCNASQVPMTTIAVDVSTGGSLEASARKARYRAFRDFLQSGDLLLLAHHLDDQVETLLFRLFRGSRVVGLEGMPAERPVGRATLYRPLLQHSRSDILTYARDQGLAWVEDESNAHTTPDRNYIRHSVLPTIEARWPGVRNRLLTKLKRDSHARDLLDKQSFMLLDSLRLDTDCLNLVGLQELEIDTLVDLLGAWLSALELPMPPGNFLREVAAAIVSNRRVGVNFGELEVRQNRDRLYALRRLPTADKYPFALSVGQINVSGGSVTNRVVQGSGLREDDYTVRFRKGGETLRQGCSKSLKNLFQESGLPPWLRDRLPLIYRNKELVALAGVPGWGFSMQIAEGYVATAQESGFAVSLHLEDRL